MVSQRRLFIFLTVIVFVSLLVVACERPLTNDGADQTGDTGDQTGQTDDPNAGGGTDGAGDTTAGDTGEGTAGTDETGSDTGQDTATDDGGDTAADGDDGAQDDGDEAGGGAGDAGDAGDSTDSGDDSQADGDDAGATDDGADDATGDDTASDDSANDTAAGTAGDTATTIPATHTVVAGENLYRIGLKYGISWVAIANENNLANPNLLSIGQVLNLPGGGTPDPGPTPSPQTETTYVVKQGDNLYRIGLQFGISWVQIAEANGLINPNLIKVGDELKIPVNTPGPAPQFSHVVKQGETLFLISLQYGVAWPSIAEANNLSSPYVIYVGQTLVIPGSQ